VTRVGGLVRRGIDSAPTRIALVATAIVAAVYLVVSVVVIIVVSSNLTHDIDNRLSDNLARIQQTGRLPPQFLERLNTYRDPESQQFGTPLLIWVLAADGTPLHQPANPDALLPPAYDRVTGPQTVSVSGAEVRVQGYGPVDVVSSPGVIVPNSWIVVGQSTSSVVNARNTVIVAESLVGPALLLVVFLGALTIGRRVAAPLERARRRQLEFTADASHELRTPLAVIEAEATLALSQPRSAESYRISFEKVDRESKRLRHLVDDLLWLARFDATPDPPGAELVDLGVLSRGAAERFSVVAESRSLHLTSTVSGTASPIVLAPADWLDRLLGVLLDNACRYADQGGQVSVQVTADGSRVRLTVDDSGPGIPREHRDQIFDRFHRATAAGGGSGLGLAIGDAVVRATGGRWEVGESAMGGASMNVIWPRAGGTPLRDPAPVAAAEQRPSPSTT